MKLKSRYVGARPFETEQQLIFKGRQADTEGVFRLIQLENLVVLYGKSGTGKSSLLNAGIMPKVKAETDFIPIRVRFNAYKEGEDFFEPSVSTRLSVRGTEGPHITFLDNLIPNENSLWHDVKEHYIRYKGEKGLLLVIDQFEELFTYPVAHINAFQEQLSEALFKTVPQRYWDVLEAKYAKGTRPLSNDELKLFQSKSALKVVLSIRSDRLHLLNRLDEQLPTILKNLYELDALKPEAAQQAIVEPAAMPKMDLFDTEPFLYEPQAIECIIDFLTHERAGISEGTDDNELIPLQQKIESTQLQIICNAVEKKVRNSNIRMVKVADLGNLYTIIEQYYNTQILNLDADEQLPARRLIEEGLVFEEEERRLSIYEGQIFKTYKVKIETLRKLVDSHLLRAEPSLNGGYTYELSHDTLVSPVLKAKKLRLDADRKIVEEKMQMERAVELKKAQELAAVEKKRRQRSNLFLLLAIIGLACAIGLSYLAWQQQQKAEKALKKAEEAESVANSRLVEALEEQVKRQKLELEASERKRVIFKKSEEYSLDVLEEQLSDSLGLRLIDNQATLDSLKNNRHE
jgi:hypothetical protein